MQGNVSASIAKIVGAGTHPLALGLHRLSPGAWGMVPKQLIIVNYSSRPLQF